ncbi:hypothetical protein GCM10027445_35120 [Amycolatopsis endophytica]|uniref:ABC-type multidrug transport system ATPase subunit n=1 Tax=Amycolatopsis endophytica TaxID=860233 RepID=A0A853BAP4_9PSEU|nr:ABC-type multidrug transport system ATPase subunit [Amycolatopsis endophytica]
MLFLDEPTTGLDPRGRSEVWAAVRELVAEGTTVLLTTQYLDEADQLAGRIAVLDHGALVAEGSPAELKSRIGGDRVEVVLHDAADLPAAAALATRVTGAEAERGDNGFSVPAHDRVRVLAGLAAAFDGAGIGIADLTPRRPTLHEVFLELTAREVPV